MEVHDWYYPFRIGKADFGRAAPPRFLCSKKRSMITHVRLLMGRISAPEICVRFQCLGSLDMSIIDRTAAGLVGVAGEVATPASG